MRASFGMCSSGWWVGAPRRVHLVKLALRDELVEDGRPVDEQATAVDREPLKQHCEAAPSPVMGLVQYLLEHASKEPALLHGLALATVEQREHRAPMPEDVERLQLHRDHLSLERVSSVSSGPVQVA